MIWPFDFFEVDLCRAHRRSSLHFADLCRSGLCGCFSCIDIFEFKDIEEWTDQGQTALCPSCGTDAVIGDYTGLPIEEDFLDTMRTRFLGPNTAH